MALNKSPFRNENRDRFCARGGVAESEAELGAELDDGNDDCGLAEPKTTLGFPEAVDVPGLS